MSATANDAYADQGRHTHQSRHVREGVLGCEVVSW